MLSGSHLAIKHVFKCFTPVKYTPAADPVLHGFAAAVQVGSYSAWFVRLLMFVSAPVTWPIGRLLDWLLGDEQTVSRAVSGHDHTRLSATSLARWLAGSLGSSSAGASQACGLRTVLLAREGNGAAGWGPIWRLLDWLLGDEQTVAGCSGVPCICHSAWC